MLTPIPILIVSLVAGRACDAHQPAHELGHALWVETAEGPRVMVVEHLHRSGDDGPSYNVHRIVAIDPEDGTVSDPWMLPQTGDMETTVL